MTEADGKQRSDGGKVQGSAGRGAGEAAGMTPEMQEVFSKAILRVLVPVVVTMLLSVYLTHSVPQMEDDSHNICLGPPEPPRRTSDPTRLNKGRPIAELLTLDLEVKEPTLSTDRLTTIIFLSSFLGCMILFTFILVLLYKYRCEKFIMGWLFFAVVVIFGWEGGRYLYDWSKGNCFALDLVTLGFVTWNFAIMGIVAVFWRSPRVVNQSFLILLSALMSYIFRTLPEWATWTILGLLVFWDIVAVLTPCGPLRMLVEIAKERGDPLPALVYDTDPQDVGRGMASSKPTQVVIKPKEEKKKDGSGETDGGDETPKVRKPDDASESQVYHAVPTQDTASAQQAPTATPIQGAVSANAPAYVKKKQEKKQLGVLGAHLKLGLGDFVFYSVLVSRSSLHGFMTTVTSFIAILTGLVLTLFLVTVYKKALPALPISITLGLVFYFATRYTVEPYVANNMPELIFN